MTRLTLTLFDDEQKALRTLSQKERRHPREQAALIIRRELERRGLLPNGDGPAELSEVQHATAAH